MIINKIVFKSPTDIHSLAQCLVYECNKCENVHKLFRLFSMWKTCNITNGFIDKWFPWSNLNK